MIHVHHICNFKLFTSHTQKVKKKTKKLPQILNYPYPLSLPQQPNVMYTLLYYLKWMANNRASLVAQSVKNLPAMQETWVQFLGLEDSLEKEMAIHSSILAWKIPWTEEPGRLQSMGLQESDTT